MSSKTSRLEGLDFARYLAFCGMVIVNFNIVMEVEAGQGALAFLTAALEGRAAATFVVLAGLGLGLAGAKRLGDTISVTLRRAAFLLAIGLLNMTVFDADILHYYAFYFLFGALLLPLRTPMLWAAIVALSVAFPAMILLLDYDQGWNWESYIYKDFWTAAGFVRNLFFNGWHPVIPWLAFLLFGIILSRKPLADRAFQRRLLIGGILAIAIAEGLSAYLTGIVAGIDPELVDLTTTSPVPPMPLYILAGMGAASVLTALCLLLSNAARATGVLQLITPAGCQTLTLYIAHILIGMGALEAMGKLGGQTPAQALMASMVFCALATAYAWLWSRRFQRGPIEALMRRLAG